MAGGFRMQLTLSTRLSKMQSRAPPRFLRAGTWSDFKSEVGCSPKGGLSMIDFGPSPFCGTGAKGSRTLGPLGRVCQKRRWRTMKAGSGSTGAPKVQPCGSHPRLCAWVPKLQPWAGKVRLGEMWLVHSIVSIIHHPIFTKALMLILIDIMPTEAASQLLHRCYFYREERYTEHQYRGLARA